MKTSRGPSILLAVVALAGFAALYAEAMTVPFWYDDVIWIVRGLRTDLPGDLFRPGHFTFVRPVTVLWFHFWAPVCGTNPLAWRLASAALYLATAAAIHALGCALGQTRRGAAASAIFFVAAAHHWELVYGVAAVGETLAGFFTTVTAAAWVCWRRDGSRLAWGVSLGALALALGSKESAMVAPLLLLLYEAMGVKEACGLPSAVTRVGPHLAMTLLLLGLDAALVHAAGKGVAPAHLAPELVRAWGRQIAASLLTVPVRDMAFTWFPEAGGASLIAWGLMMAVGISWQGGRLRGTVGFPLGWIALAWLPYLLLVPEKLDQDRYGYLASIGTALLVGGLFDAVLAWAPPPPSRRRIVVMGSSLVALMAIVGWNGWCQRQAANDLCQWLARRGDVAERVRDIAPSCPPKIPVYIFSNPGTWHEAGYAFALFAHRPLTEVRDGWDMADDRPLRSTVLLWSEEVACYMQLRDVDDPPVPPPCAQAVTWADLRTWRPVGLVDAGDGALSCDGSGRMETPLLDLSVWHVDRVVVEYRAWAPTSTERSTRAPRMWLAWSHRTDGSLLGVDSVGTDLIVDGQIHSAVLVPWLLPSWWRGGRVHRFAITPADRPMRVEMRSVRALPPPPAAARRHIE